MSEHVHMLMDTSARMPPVTAAIQRKHAIHALISFRITQVTHVNGLMHTHINTPTCAPPVNCMQLYHENGTHAHV